MPGKEHISGGTAKQCQAGLVQYHQKLVSKCESKTYLTRYLSFIEWDNSPMHRPAFGYHTVPGQQTRSLFGHSLSFIGGTSTAVVSSSPFLQELQIHE